MKKFLTLCQKVLRQRKTFRPVPSLLQKNKIYLLQSHQKQKMGEEATDNNLMIVGKAMTRHPQQTSSKPQQARTAQATLSTVGSTIASTADLPTWAQTEGGSNTMQNQIAATEELPGWAKTQTHTSRKKHINTDNIVAQAPITASDKKLRMKRTW